MQILSLLMWVGQFGFSALFPLCFFLLLAVRLRSRYGLGLWIVFVLGFLGLLTGIRTAMVCLRAMRTEAERLCGEKAPPQAFNDHE